MKNQFAGTRNVIFVDNQSVLDYYDLTGASGSQA